MKPKTFLTISFLSVLLASCAPGEFGAGAKMATVVLSGAACGVAAANGTPCTPQAVLDALERDAAAQRSKIKAVAPQASAADPELTQKILDQLAANAESNRRLTEAVIMLATRGSKPEEAPKAPAQ